MTKPLNLEKDGVEFGKDDLVYWRGDKIPAGWKYLRKYDNVPMPPQDADEGENDELDDDLEFLTRRRPTYKDAGIRVICRIGGRRVGPHR